MQQHSLLGDTFRVINFHSMGPLCQAAMLSSGILFATEATAQTTLTLPGAAKRSEQSGAFFPSGKPSVGTPVPLLHQIAYAPSQLATVGPRTWRQLSFRPDRAGWAKPIGARLAVRLSARNAPSPEAMSWTDRRLNRGTDLVQVIDSRSIVLPAVPPSNGGAPQPPIPLPFDRPYPYPGSNPGGLGLVVELEFQQAPAQPLLRPTWDAAQPVWERKWSAALQTIGTGCAPGRIGLTYQTLRGTEDLLMFPNYGSARGPSIPQVVMLIGRKRAPLSLASIGAPGCNLHLDPLACLPTTAAVSSTSTIHYGRLVAPKSPQLLGAEFRTQAFVADPQANRAGFTLSQALNVKIVQQPPQMAARVMTWLAGTNGTARLPRNDLYPVITLQ